MNFDQPYSHNDFTQFISDFLPDDYQPIEKNISYQADYIQKVRKLGECKTLDLEVFEAMHNSAHDARVGLSREAFQLMQKHSYCNRALIAFVPADNSGQWRFSLLQIELEQQDHSTRLTKNYSNPRRYSFLLGEGSKIKTPYQFLCKEGKIRQQRRGNKDFTAWEDLCYRFSVETLTKEFYAELSNWYFWALQHVDFPNDFEKDKEINNSTSVIRLITRLMFVWFLKQKKLIADELFDTQELENLLNFSDKTGSTFYKAILQNLFFASLNTEMGEKRKFIHRQSGVQGFYRYERFFKNKERFLELTKNIPFLNGGLFENLDKNVGEENEMRIDCFSNRPAKEQILKVPDFLFFGDETQVDLNKIYDTKGKTYKVRGLIDILKTYNFTIEENTPTDIEVALDPELLGKVFENLLASYNPETQTTARKQTGSFYTPREIVDYMCKETLLSYLKGVVKETIPEEKLQKLFSNDTELIDLNEPERTQLAKAIDNCKILDPACGSGAFPMGILQKMVHILQKIDPNNEQWEKIQKERASQENIELIEKIERDRELMMQISTLPELKAQALKELEYRLQQIENAFTLSTNELDYARKLFLIENCIFGVDIQPIAVQISKLRFFISLLVEQKVNDNLPNRGIIPMPNMETKFVTANTLVGLSNENVIKPLALYPLEEKLNDVRHKHFSARTTETKRKYRDLDQKIRDDISVILKDAGYSSFSVEQIAEWNPYDQNAKSPFFDAEWMFGVSEGFDIVIGNPPYVSALTMARSEKIKNYFKQEYPLATGSYDIYVLFLLRAIKLLNKNGIYTWIIPNKFLVADYATKTKNELINNQGLIHSVDVSIYNVFKEASVYPIVIVGAKNYKNEFSEFFLENYEDLSKRLFKKPTGLKQYKTFKDFGIKINSGTTGFQAQHIKELLSEFKEKERIPFVVSGSIDRYVWSNENVRYMGYNYSQAFIENNSDIIANSKWAFWKNPKIVVAGMTKVIEAVFFENALGLGVGIYGIYDYGNFLPYCLTAILNSKFMSYYFQIKFKDKHLAGGYLAINKSTIEGLPLIEISKENQKKLSDISKQIHILKKENPAADTAALEREIDVLVYGLYGLTEEEIKIIEGK